VLKQVKVLTVKLVDTKELKFYVWNIWNNWWWY